MNFSELKISQSVLKAVREKKYEKPTPIQEKAIPIAMNGRDLFGIAQTGTGKTAAYAIPIIERLLKNYDYREKSGKHAVKALILAPTRELAIQIDESFTDYAKYTPLNHVVIYGGTKQKAQTDRLRRGTDILIATPGRLIDLINQGFIRLNSVEYFVLDEADRMLDMGFIHDINRIVRLLPQKRQTMLFSATMPKSIITISKSILVNPATVEVTPESSVIDTIEQQIYIVEKPQKLNLLIEVLNEQLDKSVLIFSRTKHGADKITRLLNKKQISCAAIHSNKSQNARQTVLNNFKAGRIRIIVATDIASRGIDIANLGLVINYDMPDMAETYVHRIGRTGRAKNHGIALSFCSNEERTMVRDIQKLIGQKLPVAKATA